MQSANCLSCFKKVKFNVYHGGFSNKLAIYCSGCPCVLYIEDFSKLPNTHNKPTNSGYSEYISEFENFDKTLPKCKCGGEFKYLNNPKCPQCKGEFFGDIYKGKPIYKMRDFNLFEFNNNVHQ